jgi:hypothetical protein
VKYVPVAIILAALGFTLVAGFFSPDAATSFVVLALVLSFAAFLLVIVGEYSNCLACQDY